MNARLSAILLCACYWWIGAEVLEGKREFYELSAGDVLELICVQVPRFTAEHRARCSMKVSDFHRIMGKL